MTKRFSLFLIITRCHPDAGDLISGVTATPSPVTSTMTVTAITLIGMLLVGTAGGRPSTTMTRFRAHSCLTGVVTGTGSNCVNFVPVGVACGSDYRLKAKIPYDSITVTGRFVFGTIGTYKVCYSPDCQSWVEQSATILVS